MLDDYKLPNEEFKDIEDFKGYAISNKGRIYSYKSDKILSQQTGTFCSPYPNEKYVRVTRGKEYHNLYIHLMVATYFVPNPSGKRMVRHKDDDTFNNNADNLEWVGRAGKYTEEWIRNRMSKKKYQYKVKLKALAKRVVCTNYDIEFESLTKASEILEISTSTIKKACDTGKCVHGLYFEFVTEEDD